MLLKALTLENFKGIRDSVRLELAPLTLLFGPNNAGKSTVVQALMYAREVLERNNCDAGQTQLGGGVVDLGGFENLVYGRDLRRIIRMRFELDLRDIPLPKYSDWVREHELDGHVWNQYSAAPKHLDISAAHRVQSSIKDAWVQIEIAWRRDPDQAGTGRPVVQAYSVGHGQDTFAKISLNDEGKARLSEIGFGVPPFGTTYYQGDASDLDWALACASRGRLRRVLQTRDAPGLGVKQGATVALPGEQVEPEHNRLSRKAFDEVVSKIVKGNDAWGDPTIDPATGAPNPYYQARQQLIELAEALVNLTRVAETPNTLQFPDLLVGAQDHPPARGFSEGSAPPQVTSDGPVAIEFDDRRRISDLVAAKKETESWLLDLFDALVYDDYVPSDEERNLPLSLRGTALPEWGKTLEPDPRVWLPNDKEDYQNQFWEYPVFVQEYVKDLLTSIVTGPGELLCQALKNSVYLSPFREMPARHYQPARSPEPRRWANGLAAWDWLLLKGKPLVIKVNKWLAGKRGFDAGYEIDLRHYRELEVDSAVLAALTAVDSSSGLDLGWVRNELLKLPEGRRLMIRDLRTEISHFPQDLGVGISQLIPVIVAALHNESGVVAIEEPESNIHPAFQVVLADLFITQAKAHPNVLFLVETHSEHLMLRCLRRIRETTEGGEGHQPVARPEDIAVHFVEPGEKGPSIHRIQIDEGGDFIDPWPRGFFRERLRELYGDDL